MIYFTNCFCEATAAASSAPRDAVAVLSSAKKVWEKSDDKYQSIITTPIARNMVLKLRTRTLWDNIELKISGVATSSSGTYATHSLH